MSAAPVRRALLGWAVDSATALATTLPAYLVAVWSYIGLYLATADGEHLGWLVLLWPLLLLPPLLPWLTIALPAALAAGVPHALGRPLALFAALVWTAEHWPIATPPDATGTASIGRVDPGLFVSAIWLAVAIVLIVRRRRTPA